MSIKNRIYNVLLVSASGSFNSAVTELFPSSRFQPVCITACVNEARHCLSGRAFDFVIINSPLPDESGIQFALDCSLHTSTVVLLLVRKDSYQSVHDRVAEHGIFTLPKPTSRTFLSQVRDWMMSTKEHLRIMNQKSASIEGRLEELRIMNRAKCLLIGELHMTEPEAHHYIEKDAMDHCIPIKEAAETVIRLYS